MSDLPETVWLDPDYDAENSFVTGYGHAIDEGYGFVPYIRADHAQAFVAGAYQAAAEACGNEAEKHYRIYKSGPPPHRGSSYVEGISDGMADAERDIRALTPSDAQAALDAAIERAVREERERCARIAEAEGVGDTTNANAEWFKHARRIAAAIRKDTE